MKIKVTDFPKEPKDCLFSERYEFWGKEYTRCRLKDVPIDCENTEDCPYLHRMEQENER